MLCEERRQWGPIHAGGMGMSQRGGVGDVGDTGWQEEAVSGREIR